MKNIIWNPPVSKGATGSLGNKAHDAVSPLVWTLLHCSDREATCLGLGVSSGRPGKQTLELEPTCLRGAVAAPVVSLLIEPADHRRHRVEVFQQQQGQEGIGRGLHIVELLAGLFPAVPICTGNTPASHPLCT